MNKRVFSILTIILAITLIAAATLLLGCSLVPGVEPTAGSPEATLTVKSAEESITLISALDPETRENLQRELARVHHELGTTTLHVTYDFEEAVALGDRIAVVHAGRIVQVGTPEDIFRRPANEFMARFVGVRNIFTGPPESPSIPVRGTASGAASWTSPTVAR